MKYLSRDQVAYFSTRDSTKRKTAYQNMRSFPLCERSHANYEGWNKGHI